MAEIEKKFSFPAIHAGARPQNQPIVRASDLSTNAGEKEIDQTSSSSRLVGKRASDHPAWQESHPESDRTRGQLSEDAGAVTTKADDAHIAALRQMAYEVLKSPELLKLAG